MSETRTITISQAKRSLLKAFQKKRPVFLWGPPGIGKSELVHQVAHEMGGAVIDVRLTQMDPTDLRGIPYYNSTTNQMAWAPPDALPTQEFADQYPIVVLLFDEVNSAPPSIQASTYQLFLDRRVGNYVLPKNVVMVAAGNRESDRGVTYRLPRPLANRFIHQELRVDFECWQDWAIHNNIHPDVVGYLNFAKQDLCETDSSTNSRSFPTPRVWTFVSDLLQDDDTDDDTLMNLVAGTVGEGLAIKFMAHRRYASQLPNPNDILTGKVTELKTKEISAMYSLITSMCYQLKEACDNGTDETKLYSMVDNFFRFSMDNFETELVVMATRIILKVYELPIKPTKLKSFKEYFDRYGKYVMGS